MGKKVHASLFSGFGAADLAATWMGWDNAFWCEIDDFPRRVLEYWFPESIGYGNIKETDFTEWRGKIDVLSGGFPCQPFSVAGRRKGKDDDRYLWPEMLRAIREIQPTWVVGENVVGILSMVQPGHEAEVEHQAALFEATDKKTILEQEYVVETICRDIEQEGYTIQPVVIPACAVGAPHRRDRVFFIAHRADAGSKSMQCEGENGTDQPSVASDTNSKRCDDWSDNWEKRPVCHNEERDTQENKSKRAERKCRTCENGEIVTYSQSTRSEGECEYRQRKIQFNGRNSEKMQSRWQVFPTQPPVCRRDDGLPFDVERLTISFPKWREGSIKGYGNAIVPQVMYEIFKAINQEK